MTTARKHIETLRGLTPGQKVALDADIHHAVATLRTAALRFSEQGAYDQLRALAGELMTKLRYIEAHADQIKLPIEQMDEEAA